MHKLTFYPLGNADCCCIDLENGKKLLVDFGAKKDLNDENDKRCDLPTLIREELEKDERDYFDIVAFTHLDDDHYRGASEFFWLEHAKKYQGDDRIKINTLWVPAAVITEASVDDPEAKILQRESRHRFKNGAGIRVFSRPGKLEKWCGDNGISFEDRKNLITDAGKTAKELSLEKDGIEFFVHSPFAKRLNENDIEDRNSDSLVFHVTFRIEDVYCYVLFLADTPCDNLEDIIEITKIKGRSERLKWDVAKLPHHCSYRSLGTEKGEDKTEPLPGIAWLWKEQCQQGSIIVSTSKPIPKKGGEDDEEKHPPHRQAANFYKEALSEVKGIFVVTMENPSQKHPRPLVIEIDKFKATLKRSNSPAGFVASTTRTPRAGE